MTDSLATLRTHHDSDQVVLESTFRQEFVEAFKRAVPFTDRTWNPETLFRLAAAVNDSDGHKRRLAAGWARGVVVKKDASLFGMVNLSP